MEHECICVCTYALCVSVYAVKKSFKGEEIVVRQSKGGGSAYIIRHEGWDGRR